MFLQVTKLNILTADLIVKSSAIKNNNVEILEARKNSIPVISRAELLSNMLEDSYNILYHRCPR